MGGSDPLFGEAFKTAWRHLRSLRASPPGAAGGNQARRATFTAALEQAEQLFGAAATADVMTKPLQLFYGLSQASRAIAAAAPNVPDHQQGKPAEPWKLSGHGIAIPAMEQSVAACGGKLGALPVADKGLGAFTQMAGILNCGSLIDKKPDSSKTVPVTVGEIWRTLPESVGFWLADSGRFPMLAVDNNGPFNLPYGTNWDCGLVEGIPDSVKQSATPDGLKDFLTHYPAAGPWTLPSESLGTAPADMWFPGHVHPQLNVVALLWPAPTGPSTANQISDGVCARVGTRYFKDTFLFPALGDNTRPLHPLLAWWAVLYALSMVARYEPCAWTEMTAINTSIEASPIEHMLETAVIRLPRLILDVIDDLNP
jgi:hypothetical protein